MWWMDLLWGLWNGLTAWVVFWVHVFGGWADLPMYNTLRGGNWYDLGFLLGAGSPLLGMLGRRSASSGVRSWQPDSGKHRQEHSHD